MALDGLIRDGHIVIRLLRLFSEPGDLEIGCRSQLLLSTKGWVDAESPHVGGAIDLGMLPSHDRVYGDVAQTCLLNSPMQRCQRSGRPVEPDHDPPGAMRPVGGPGCD